MRHNTNRSISVPDNCYKEISFVTSVKMGRNRDYLVVQGKYDRMDIFCGRVQLDIIFALLSVTKKEIGCT